MADKIIDPFTNIDLRQLPAADTSNDPIFLSNLQALNVGQGGGNVFRADKQGIWLGGKTFDVANFSVTMDGAMTANSFNVVGGTIRYGKTSFTDNAHSGYFISPAGIYAGSAGDATKLKFTIADGTFDLVGTISGRNSAIIASAINSYGHFIDDRLDTSTKQILGDFTFGVSGAIRINSSADTGVWISPNGILGKQSGTTTFALDTAGNATFKGSITASTITGSTITGSTLQTATSGKRIRISSSPQNIIEFLYDNTVVGSLKIDSDGEGGYYIDLFGEGGSLKIGTTLGTSYMSYFEAPWFSGTGKAAAGSVYLEGSPNYPRKAGLTWSGGGEAYWSFYLGDALARIGSHIYPYSSGSYDLGSSSYKWNDLYIKGISLNGTYRTSWPSEGIDSLSDLSIDTTKNWGGYGISGLGSLLPYSSSSYDLGSSSYYWNDVYADYLRFNSNCGRIYWGSDIVFDILSSDTQCGKHLVPRSLTANLNLGSSSLYWNEVNYKTLTDRGCLGSFDDGVEMSDGKIVSDLEALKLIKKHPSLKTIYGVPRFDYSTMPKAVFKPAPIATEDVYDKTEKSKLLYKKGDKMGEDGAETTALISIMIGAIKELNDKIEKSMRTNEK